MPPIKVTSVEALKPEDEGGGSISAGEVPIGGLPDDAPPTTTTTRAGIAPAADDEVIEPRKRPRCTPKLMCIDFVEDQMRSRLVAVFATLAFYLIVGGDFIKYQNTPQDLYVARVIFASSLPSSGYLGPSFSERAATLHVISTSGGGFKERLCPNVHMKHMCDYINARNYTEPVYASARVVGISYLVEPKLTLRCDTAHRKQLAGTLEDVRLARSCTPGLIEEGRMNATDGAGVVSFPQLTFGSGPPGEYEVAFTAAEDAHHPPHLPLSSSAIRATAKTVLMSSVAVVRPVNGGGATSAQVGVPLPVQPVVQVVDSEGRGLANRTVVVWSSTVPNIYREWFEMPTTFPGVDFAALGKTTHHMRGQSIALLEGETAVTDADGVAHFTSLTITASSSRFGYLNFYCEGRMASWNDPYLLEPTSGSLAAPQQLVSAIFISSSVTQINTLAPGPAGTNASVFGDDLTEATCPEAPIRVVEGEAMNQTMRVRIGRLGGTDGATFVPVVGERVIAVMHTAAGVILPLMFETDMDNLARETNRTLPPRKRLTNAISTPSDENGVAYFPALGFTERGQTDHIVGNVMYRPTFHKIAFCTAGATSSDELDGCSLSCPIQVVSSLAHIEWSVQPSVVRSGRVPRMQIGMGESYYGGASGPGGPLVRLPPTAVVRLIDADGRGQSKKRFIPMVYIPSVANSTCALSGVELTDEDHAAPWNVACAMQSLHIVKQSYVGTPVPQRLREQTERACKLFRSSVLNSCLALTVSRLRSCALQHSPCAPRKTSPSFRMTKASSRCL